MKENKPACVETALSHPGCQTNKLLKQLRTPDWSSGSVHEFAILDPLAPLLGPLHYTTTAQKIYKNRRLSLLVEL